MKKTPIKFIYFDVGGVLLNFVHAHKKVAAQYNVPYESVLAVFENNWREECRGNISPAQYMQLFADALGMTDVPADAGDFWSDHFLSVTPMHELARALSTTHQVGILSNAGPGVLDHSMRKGHIPDIPWSAIIDSSRHGVIKPEEKIYEIAEKAAGVSPEEILFIDDVPENITAATARGWQGIVMDTSDPQKTIERIKRGLIAEEVK